MGKMMTENQHVPNNNIMNLNDVTASEDYLNRKIAFIQNHINNLLIEITNLPEPWTYAVTEDGRVFFINEDEQRTTWLHPKTGQPVSVMIVPPLEDLPTGWQKDYILGLPYLIDHNSKKNFLNSLLNKTAEAVNSTSKSPDNHIRPEIVLNTNSNEVNQELSKEEEPKSIIKKGTNSSGSNTDYSSMRSPSKSKENLSQLTNTLTSSPSKKLNGHKISADISSSSSSLTNSNNNNSYTNQNNNNVDMNHFNTAIDSALRKYGWLYKLSHNGLKLWRKRYFVLTDYILDYYSDSTMSKHCGTIFLNNTQSRPSTKKDGSSAYNRKYSFKVELIRSESNNKGSQNLNSTNGFSNDLFIYLAADSTANMNEWINKFNFVSKLKDNNNTRTGFIEKRGASNRSSSNVSTKNSNHSSSFIVKHDNSSNKSKSFNRFSKSNSAPNSPNLDSSKHSKKSDAQQVNKLRSSISTSTNMNRIGENSTQKKVKKKLAFSDDEILNDRPHSSTRNSSRNHLSDYETDENLNNSSNDKKHKRGSSLTKSTRSSRKSNTGNYDYKPIYDAFERPIHEMTKIASNLALNNINQQQQPKSPYSNNTNYSKNYSHVPPMNGKYNTINKMIGIDRNPKYESDFAVKFEAKASDNYMDRDKIAAAHAAANAAVNAIEKDKVDVGINNNPKTNQSPNYSSAPSTSTPPKIINCFYNITQSQIEELPKNEVQMLIRQLRRNFVLLNQSQQRFSIIQKLYEPYELIYQHKQNQSQLTQKNEEGYNMNELTQFLHDSYQTIKDRTLKIELKMDSVENSLRLASQYHEASSTLSDESNESRKCFNNPKYSSYFRLYEYQIVEMQHEYELLLEDKIIIEKLLDNQMKIFGKYENLSNEKTLIQQFNTLTLEMDQLKLQLNKVNQLLNDTISEKCKQEIIHTQQQTQAQQQQVQQQNYSSHNNYMQHSGINSTFNSKSDNGNLFRASLVPVGATNNSLVNGDTKSVSSIWKLSNTPMNELPKKNLNNNGVQFSSIDNLADEYVNKYKNNNYAQLETPQLKTHKQYRSSMYNPNHHYYYLNNIENSIKNNKLDHNISKSIDALYSSETQNLPNELNNGVSNHAQKKTALLDLKDDYKELPVKFQPVNFTQSRPNQNGSNQQQPSQPKVVRDNFKRDSMAEKKRASIGKFPQNLNYSSIQKSNELFQPIPSQQQSFTNVSKNQQSARERLFGNNQNYGYVNQSNQQQQTQNSMESELHNNRKIAMVKPELRTSENELIQRFTQQNQMEYFDADYSEIINKNIQKPDVYSIPNRGNLEIEPEVELTEDEQRAKEKRMLEIKKMIALQSLQQVDDANTLNSTYTFGNKQNNQSNYSDMVNFDREKKAREQLIELRHELAEQIKEKTRQNAQLAAMNGSNGFSTSSTSSSIPIELENRSNESKLESIIQRSPENFNIQNMSQASYFNSTPAPPPPAAFHSIFNMNSLKSNSSYIT